MFPGWPPPWVMEATTPRFLLPKHVLFLDNCYGWVSCSVQATFLGRPRHRAWIFTLFLWYNNNHERRMAGCGQCFGNHEVWVGYLWRQTLFIDVNCRKGEWRFIPSLLATENEGIEQLLVVYLSEDHFVQTWFTFPAFCKACRCKRPKLCVFKQRWETSLGASFIWLGLFHIILFTSVPLLTAPFSSRRWGYYSRGANYFSCLFSTSNRVFSESNKM